MASAFNSLLTERILKGDQVRKDEGTRNLVSDWLAASLPRNSLKLVFFDFKLIALFHIRAENFKLEPTGKKKNNMFLLLRI